MTTEEKIAVMQAFCEGKTIQMYYNSLDVWKDYTSGEPLWNWRDQNYRIKQKPKYISFDFSDAESLIGKVIKSKNSKNIFLITGYDVSENYFIVGNTTQNFKTLFENCEFLDGSPCGKLNQ